MHREHLKVYTSMFLEVRRALGQRGLSPEDRRKAIKAAVDKKPDLPDVPKTVAPTREEPEQTGFDRQAGDTGTE